MLTGWWVNIDMNMTVLRESTDENMLIRPTAKAPANAHFCRAIAAGMRGEHLLPPLLQETMSSVAGSLTKSYLQRRQCWA